MTIRPSPSAIPGDARDATELQLQLNDGRMQATAVVGAYLERIAREDAHWHAYADVYADGAMAQAEAADRWRRGGMPCPPLQGLPISLKDLFHIQGRVTTFGSATRRDAVATETSAIVQTLLQAGAVVLGKTHMGEFAYGGWGINPHMGTPRNPWGRPGAHHAPGGSSSGAAVSVSAGLACAAIGSDTGGSVRVPAAFNGLTGFKPTFGRLDTTGSLAMSASLDSIGMITRSARDARLLLNALAPSSRCASCEGPWRLAYLPVEHYPCEVAPSIQSAQARLLDACLGLGATLHPVSFPFDLGAMMRSSDDIIQSEVYAVHASNIDDVSLPFGDWVAGRIRAGRSISAQRYLQALAQRAAWRDLYWRTMRPYDAYVLPTTPCAAPLLADIDEHRSLIGMFTRWVNYVGGCALSVPVDIDPDGLPIGIQLVGKPGEDDRLLSLGVRLQGETDWHLRRPGRRNRP